MATNEMAAALPHLSDDDQAMVEMDHEIHRDNLPNLKFKGTRIAAVAPDSAPRGRWHEYRVYLTSGGSMVLSKIGRSILDGERDKHEVMVLKTIKDGAMRVNDHPFDRNPNEREAYIKSFFGMTDLAKKLYAAIDIESAERLD